MHLSKSLKIKYMHMYILTRSYSPVEYPMRTMKLSHMNFTRSPNII